MKKELVLASGSPRRQQMMRDVGYEFAVRNLDIDESFGDMPAPEVAEFLAKKKNAACRAMLQDEVIVTADTVVVHDGKILGKPVDEKEACEMIKAMSAQEHQVISAVCISDGEKSLSYSDEVVVTMMPLSKEEIEFYVKQFQPMDKAGAYGIQEWIGMVGVEKISGSFYSVVGMPIHWVYKSLKDNFGIFPNQ
ncbi:Maf family protein [Reichenbachiella ulvae]|uniref:dTTP/UTP pyrophosphatase n=1 Tax=Reichenbachiella ulvae TaxID=2980104 RepID=A0ABT3CPS3_9BACT|nr:Maf family nucleotide pyrophosphatase [Reichenbachiella ulvae]MCV9385686.1 Maf family nucleotide pyrophosphatase [Reichenbachiella ulvae]